MLRLQATIPQAEKVLLGTKGSLALASVMKSRLKLPQALVNTMCRKLKAQLGQDHLSQTSLRILEYPFFRCLSKHCTTTSFPRTNSLSLSVQMLRLSRLDSACPSEQSKLQVQVNTISKEQSQSRKSTTLGLDQTLASSDLTTLLKQSITSLSLGHMKTSINSDPTPKLSRSAIHRLAATTVKRASMWVLELTILLMRLIRQSQGSSQSKLTLCQSNTET